MQLEGVCSRSVQWRLWTWIAGSFCFECIFVLVVRGMCSYRDAAAPVERCVGIGKVIKGLEAALYVILERHRYLSTADARVVPSDAVVSIIARDRVPPRGSPRGFVGRFGGKKEHCAACWLRSLLTYYILMCRCAHDA